MDDKNGDEKLVEVVSVPPDIKNKAPTPSKGTEAKSKLLSDANLPHHIDKEMKKTRQLLLLYFHPAVTFSPKKITLHVFYCILFVVHTVELVLISVQMFKFGHNRSLFSTMMKQEETVLHNLLLEGWDAERETLPYPPAQGQFAVYDKETLAKKVEYAVLRYYSLEQDSLGFLNIRDLYEWQTMGIKVNLKLYNFIYHYEHDNFLTGQEELEFKVDHGLNTSDDGRVTAYDITEDLINQNFTEKWTDFLSLTLAFNVSSIKFFAETEQETKDAMCIQSEVKILFEDTDNTGQVIVSMKIRSNKMRCEALGANIADWSLQTASVRFGMAVIVACSIGLLCTLSVFVSGITVLMKTKTLMRKYFKDIFNPDDSTETDLPTGEYLRMVSFWNIFMLLSEILTIYGTIKIIFRGERISLGLDDLDGFIIILGCGCFLAWLSVLRIVRFHRKFRLLLSTVWLAASDVFAYLLCVGIMFVGYFIVGYVVLGPYNFKFRTPTNSLETLSALVNGDEIYTTMNIMECEEHGVIWWFSRVYLWSYIASFTIIILNLLIAIFMSAYEAIKEKGMHREVSPEIVHLEIVLREFIETHTEEKFRKSLHDILTSFQHFDSAEGHALKSHWCRVSCGSADGREDIIKRPRTIRELMKGATVAPSFKCCGVDFAFVIKLLKQLRKP